MASGGNLLIERDRIQSDAPVGYTAYRLRVWGVLYRGRAAGLVMEQLPFDDRPRATLVNFEGDVEYPEHAGTISHVYFPSAYVVPDAIASIDVGPPPASIPQRQPAMNLAVFRLDPKATTSTVSVYRGVIPGLVVSGTFFGAAGATQKPSEAMTVLHLDKPYWVGSDFRMRPADTQDEASVIRVPFGASLPQSLLAK